jgi:hypothetical protein
LNTFKIIRGYGVSLSVKRTGTGLLFAGAVTALVIRGGLFLLSTGEFQPAFGSDQFGNGIASLILDVLVAAILFGAALAAASTPNRPVYAYALGWIYILDCVIYGATAATFYLTSGEADGPAWIAAVPAVVQIPLVVLSIMIIRRSAWSVTRRAGDPSPVASRPARSMPDPGDNPA